MKDTLNLPEEVQALAQHMQANGITPPPTFLCDGKTHRFRTPATSKRPDNGWYLWFPEGVRACVYGDHSRPGERFTWTPAGHSTDGLPPTDRALIEAAHKAQTALMEARAREQEARYEQAAQAARRVWEALPPAPEDTPYLTRKKIPAGPCKVSAPLPFMDDPDWRALWDVDANGKPKNPDYPVLWQGSLVVPVYGPDGLLTSLQYIPANPRYKKHNRTGGRMKGGHVELPGEASHVLICEGYATGQSLNLATGYVVFCAFSADNLHAVASLARARYPAAALCVCGDNDLKEDGSNPGEKAAYGAARKVGAAVALPPGPGDFNDLYLTQGREAVREAVEAAPASPPILPEPEPPRPPASRRTKVESIVEAETGLHPKDLPRPEYIQTANSIHEDADKAIEALASLGWETPWIPEHRWEAVKVYTRAGVLVGVSEVEGRWKITPLPAETLRARISAALDWKRTYRKRTPEGMKDVNVPENVPSDVANIVHKAAQHPGVRELVGVRNMPILRTDGTLAQAPGYDPVSKILYRPTVLWPLVPEQPTYEDARAAAALLLDWVADFPWCTDDDAGVWLAYVLTLCGREAVDGHVPFFAIDASTRGSGKSTLADIASIIAYGREAERRSWIEEDGEFRKAALAIALEAVPSVVFDNVTGPIGGQEIEKLITASYVQGRLLGFSKDVEAPQRAVFCSTANNTLFTRDMPRRVVSCRLEPNVERPETRTGFRVENILSATKERRAEFATAALTILRAHVVAGMPNPNPEPFGSFEAWMKRIRAAVVWATDGIDPMKPRRVIASDDSTVNEVVAWIEALYGVVGSAPFTAVSILEAARNPLTPHKPVDALRAQFESVFMPKDLNDGLPSPKSLGWRLRGLNGKVSGGMKLRKVSDSHPPQYAIEGVSDNPANLSRLSRLFFSPFPYTDSRLTPTHSALPASHDEHPLNLNSVSVTTEKKGEKGEKGGERREIPHLTPPYSGVSVFEKRLTPESSPALPASTQDEGVI